MAGPHRPETVDCVLVLAMSGVFVASFRRISGCGLLYLYTAFIGVVIVGL